MRIFVSIDVSNKEIINSIKNFQDSIKVDAKAVELKNLHFTLQFLGEISESNIQLIVQELKKIEFLKFKICLKGIGFFPNIISPKIIWVGTDENSSTKMIDLSKKIQKSLGSLGFTSNKSFKPHITVFRIKKKIGDIRKEMETHENINFGTQEISSFKLKKSQLTPNGPIYTDLMEFN
ncbi:RNA 2',3'-cyclic phosphodiesterase [Nitrosopumilus sp.]|nr:RNA 2',3'-cyclic phosphodiesterase [Nitrosopumilus sp.]MDC0217558.1 RNA 2',3'-cyclic phosphodiesterase [Nitrosopumilus sp.]MDC0638144.1 RNA 2',3'-cyclic phosphodiesterase [Nitrosopumilus sp.]